MTRVGIDSDPIGPSTPSGACRSSSTVSIVALDLPDIIPRRPAVLSQVLGIVYRAISTFLIRRAGLRVGAGARTGAVTLIQRFGSALNPNIHLHMLFVDGVYTFEEGRPRFHGGCAPTRPELQRLLRSIATRVSRALESQGLLIRDDETPSLDLEPDDGFEQLLGAAEHYRIATGPHAGRKALTLHTVAANPSASNPCIAQLSGFSLHVGTRCRAHERASLERLCRYIARPALSNERLSVNDRGQVVYRLKHPFHDGTTHVVLDPMNFIARLAGPEVPLAQRARSVPRPRAHLTRYHGVFAPNCKHGRLIIPKPAHQTAREPHASRPAPMSWMQRLKRVFHIDIEHCGVCGGTLRVIACIETPEVIERILTHLAARNTGCIDNPRAPPLHAPDALPPASPSPTLS